MWRICVSIILVGVRSGKLAQLWRRRLSLGWPVEGRVGGGYDGSGTYLDFAGDDDFVAPCMRARTFLIHNDGFNIKEVLLPVLSLVHESVCGFYGNRG